MFKYRHYTLELLDGVDIAPLDLFQNLKELDTINHLLGGYNNTLKGLERVVSRNTQAATTVVDIGCGGGDTLKQIDKWSKQKGYQLNLFGVDLKQECVNYANQNSPNSRLTFICDDYRNAHLHLPKIDVLHACLFCHHLSENQIIELIQYAQKNRIILIINDLERNSIAYYSIKLLTRLFSNSYLVKNDAPLSVLRGFKKTEWIAILRQAKATNYTLRWQWAFRHQIIIKPT